MLCRDILVDYTGYSTESMRPGTTTMRLMLCLLRVATVYGGAWLTGAGSRFHHRIVHSLTFQRTELERQSISLDTASHISELARVFQNTEQISYGNETNDSK